MALRRAKPISWKVTGCSDAVDGTGAFEGAMTSLKDLVPDPTTNHLFVPRAASIKETGFTGFNAPTECTALQIIGDVGYGMVSTSHFAGKDEPFVYNFKTGAFISVTGANSTNTPTTQATTGDWTPPSMDQIGSKIVVTHPGFGGAATGYYFGWFDISGFDDITTGNVATGSPTITGNPNIAGVNVGLLISGTNIPANTTVLSASAVSIDITGSTHTTNTVDGISSMTGIAVGQEITGAGIPSGTTITAVNVAGSSITISNAATATAASIPLYITGATITMSANATGNATSEAITIVGGTPAAPLWAAGNTNTYQLPGIPVFVKNFNNRAYFGVNNQAWFSDPLNAVNMTNAGQSLTIGDTTPVIGMGTTPFNSTYGGIVQSLIVFKEISIFQIQGDLAISNLTLSPVSVGVGTTAARSIVSTPLGLGFVANDGVRFVNLVGNVTPVFGQDGQGVAAPFYNALYPSRINGSYNRNTLRYSLQNGGAAGNPWQDWWYHFNKEKWTGPHSFPANLSCPWEGTFVIVPQASPAGLWESDPVPSAASSYVENGVQMSWTWQTVPLPDTGLMAENSIVETSIGLAFDAEGQIINFLALGDNGNVIDQVQFNQNANVTQWGNFTWDNALWLGGTSPYQQMQIPWSEPIVANQFSFQVNGFSTKGFRIGNLFLRYQILGYMV